MHHSVLGDEIYLIYNVHETMHVVCNWQSVFVFFNEHTLHPQTLTGCEN